jgi:hypothetical protein
VLGSQRPRIFHSPAGPAGVAGPSSGLEVIELCHSIGLELDPWQQFLLIEGLREDVEGNWLCFECAELVPRQNGKGGVLEAVALGGLFLFGDRLIGWSAHEFKTASEGFRRVRNWIEGSDDLRSQVKTVRTSHGEEGIELLDGRRLLFLARSTGSGRGFTGDRLILDEAQHLAFKMLGAILPTMSARPNPQVWYAATAPDYKVAPCDVLARLRKRAKAAADPSLMYAEWSADPHSDMCPRSCTQHDEPGSADTWAKTNPALGIRIRGEHVAKEFAAMDAQTFAQERLGVGNWPPDEEEWAVIPEAAWKERISAELGDRDAAVFAVDVSPAASWSCLAVASPLEGGRTSVEIPMDRAGVLDHRPKTDWLVPRIVAIQEQYRPLCFVIDTSGPAATIVPELEALGFISITAGAEIPPGHRGGVLVRTNAREVAQACGMFYRGVVDTKTLAHHGQAELASALSVAITRPLGEAWAWDRKGSGSDITPLVSSTLACWGLAVRGHLRRDRPAPFAIR